MEMWILFGKALATVLGLWIAFVLTALVGTALRFFVLWKKNPEQLGEELDAAIEEKAAKEQF